MKITDVRGREVLDSRGLPTVEAEVTLSDGSSGSAIIPSGKSVGKKEAHELRDTARPRWAGRGVLEAVEKVNGEIRRAVVGSEGSIRDLDALLIGLDGTPLKSRLGSNAILAVSLANARAVSESTGLPLYRLLQKESGSASLSLPTPMVNIISGGLHADRGLAMQDFLAIPLGAPSFKDALEWVGRVYHSTKEALREAGETTLLADEGGFGPRLKNDEDGLKILQKSVERAGLRPGDDVAIGLDVASSHLYRNGAYRLAGGRALDSSGMIGLLEGWVSEYDVVSIEDGCSEDDWEGWKELTKRLGRRVQLLGDDLFCTTSSLIEEGNRNRVANAVLIKPNQAGTLTEALDAMTTCRKVGYAPVVSARSGDTEDPFIADMAVGASAGQIKVGSIARSERGAKYNQLLRLEEKLGREAPYAGRRPFPFLSE